MYQSDLKHDKPSLEDKLHKLYSLNRGGRIELSFRKVYLDLLKAFDNPHLTLPPVIHVAGTNGKGSTIAMLRACLEAQGYSVHTYTSPHLIRFNERIVLNGKPITDDMLENLIDEALTLNNRADTTFFEITTTMAFAAFARTPADIALIEVGLGGRMDCTNVIESPLLSIITRIGMDHMEFLGDSLSQIAGEKAGIMKPNVPCVIGTQTEKEIYETFESHAHTVGCALHRASAGEGKTSLIGASLIGAHQQENLQTALTALDIIQERFPVSKENIEKGLSNIRWPARLQKLDANTLGLSSAYEIYLDGGHNKEAGEALAQQVKVWKETDDKPLTIILAMMKGKDVQAFIKPLVPFAQDIHVINLEGEPSAYSAQALQEYIPQASISENYQDALQKATEGRILICGSLYLAGQILKSLEE